jgi:hypothetical protein
MNSLIIRTPVPSKKINNGGLLTNLGIFLATFMKRYLISDPGHAANIFTGYPDFWAEMDENYQ